MPEQQSLIFRSHFTSARTKGHDLTAANPLVSKRAGIYLITHEASGKCYAGSAVDLCRRHAEHQRMLRRGAHENDHLQKAWNRHGQDEFSFVILFYCAPADLLFFEQRVLDYYKQKIGWRQMYNSNPNARSRLGSPKSPEECAKISARMKGNKFTLGRKLTDEHRAKISAHLIGNSYRLGIPHTEETRRKMREGQKRHRDSLKNNGL